MDAKDRRVLRYAVKLVEILSDHATPSECIRIFTGAIGLTLAWSEFENKPDIVQGVHDALLHTIGEKPK